MSLRATTHAKPGTQTKGRALLYVSLHATTHAKPGTLTKAKKNGSKIAVANAAATVRHHHQKYLVTGGGEGSHGSHGSQIKCMPGAGAGGMRTICRSCWAHLFESG